MCAALMAGAGEDQPEDADELGMFLEALAAATAIAAGPSSSHSVLKDSPVDSPEPEGSGSEAFWSRPGAFANLAAAQRAAADGPQEDPLPLFDCKVKSAPATAFVAFLCALARFVQTCSV